ncbi:MAG: hypothetical protein RJA81_2434, partial [Planctomycetota bacterium]
MRQHFQNRSLLICLIMLLVGLRLTAVEWKSVTRHSGWKQHSMSRPKPEVVTASESYGKAPSDAIILFDGKSLDSFETLGHKTAEWTVKDGYMEVRPGTGAIQTKAGFGDVQLHLEWASPNPAVGQGQDRGNSGVFFLGQFEVQVLDSYQTDTYADGQAGAIYG